MNRKAVRVVLSLWGLHNVPSLVHATLNYWLFFGRHIDSIGKARARIHPSARLLVQNSRIVVDDGVLSVGYFPDWFPALGCKDICEIRLRNSTLRAIGNVDLRPGVTIWAVNANVVIGNGTVINGPAEITSRVGVKIGSHCSIAKDTVIMDCDHHKHALAGEKPEDVAKEVIIGDHCWIGHNVTILKGVKVGEGSIIAAMSLVTKDVEARSMVGGVPARKIKENIIWEQ